MAVRVDQSGHQGLATDVDHIPGIGSIQLAFHRDDAIVVDDHDRFVRIFGSATVEDFALIKLVRGISSL